MWSFIDSHGRIIEINEDKIITVGRKNADLLLQNDNSISKLHAKILVIKSDDAESEDKLTCVVMDTGSKYGSFVIGKNGDSTRIPPEGYTVKDMDKIKFGLQRHIFTVSHTSQKYLVMISRIYGDEREKLSEVLKAINGAVCDEWNPQCNYLTCPTVKLTEKVACALVAGLYIVTKEYWYAILESANGNNELLPKPKDYTPKIDSSILVTDKISLLPNPIRKNLFKDKIFIYFDKNQRDIFSRMIELAGGSSVIYDETWKPQDCCNDSVIVIQPVESSQIHQSPSFQYRSVYLRLSQEKLRRIPESEIPLAILYCSTKQYCNPQFKYNDLLKSNEDHGNNQTLETTSKILVLETQEPSSLFKHPKNQKIHQIIPESMSINSQMPSQASSNSYKKISPAASQSKINSKNVFIPESEPIDTQTSTQMSTRARGKNLSSQNQQLNNNNHDKPRVIGVETIIPPMLSINSTQSGKKRGKQLNDSKNDYDDDEDDNDNDDDDDEDEAFEPKNKTQDRVAKLSLTNPKKKRMIKRDSNKKNENTLAKKRKLNCNSETNAFHPPENEKVLEPILERSNISLPLTPIVDTNTEPTSLPHYFSRNNLNKPKCIIPLRRLTLSDMYEWKPTK